MSTMICVASLREEWVGLRQIVASDEPHRPRPDLGAVVNGLLHHLDLAFAPLAIRQRQEVRADRRDLDALTRHIALKLVAQALVFLLVVVQEERVEKSTPE